MCGPVSKYSCDGKGPEKAWHAKIGGSPGILVDIGAVKPLVGNVFVRVQIVDTEKRGFKAIWHGLPTPEYMMSREVRNGCVRDWAH